MTDPQDIQQRLLEWKYGLLADDEVADLLREIEADPALQQQAEEAARLSSLFAKAAQLPSELVRPTTPSTTPSTTSSAAVAPVRLEGDRFNPQAAGAELLAEERRRSKRRLLFSLALCAAYLMALFVGDWLIGRLKVSRQMAMAKYAAQQIKLTVDQTEPPSVASAGKILIQAALTEGLKAQIQVKYSVQPSAGPAIFASSGMLDATGHYVVQLPKDLRVPVGTRLQVQAVCDVGATTPTKPVSVSIPLVPTRYLTHVSLDKTLYRPGETVRYRALTLQRFSLTPDVEFAVHFEIKDPAGSVIASSVMEGFSKRGVSNGSFAIPPTQVGGEYSLIARSLEGAFPDEVRKFHIQAYRAPRLRKDLEFQKDSYGPGDNVVADFTATKAEGGAAANAKLVITAEVDGQSILQQQVAADASGSAHVEFKLPTEITTGEGRLSIAIDDGGTRETLTKTIPIQLDRIEVSFYPASGDLVPTLDNRVYFVARSPQGKPVTIAGDVVDTRNRVVASIETQHDGMGRFAFTPEAHESYRLKLTKPEGLRASFDLTPPNAQQIVVIDSGSGIFKSDEQPQLTVSAMKAMPRLLMTAYCRGLLMSQQPFAGVAGSNVVTLPLPAEANGVIRVTVHDNSVSPPKPLAERLIFRQHGRQLNVQVVRAGTPLTATTPSQKDDLIFAPGDRAKVDLVLTNERGEPVSAAVGVAVVDDSVLVLADDKYPTLRSHFLVTSEVSSPEDIEDADFYLSSDPKAAEALDLLLGTQGWRRFAEKRLIDLQQDPVLRQQVERLQTLGGVTAELGQSSGAAGLYASVPVATRDVQAAESILHTAAVFFGIIVLLDLIFALSSRPRRASATMLMLVIAGLGGLGVLGCGEVQQAREAASRNTPPAAMKPGAQPAAPMTFASERADAMKDEVAAFEVEQDKVMPAPSMAAPPMALAPDPAAGDRMPALEVVQEVAVGGPKGDQDFNEELANKMPRKRSSMAAGGSQPSEVNRLSPFEVERFRAGQIDSNLLAAKTFVVREYSYRQRQKRSEVRDDFTETLFWNPLVISDDKGRASIEFDLSDSITTFRVTAHGHDNSGRLGTGTGEVVSRRAFYLEPKLPLEVTVGDRIDLPVAVVNGSSRPFDATINLLAEGPLSLIGTSAQRFNLAADSRGRGLFGLNVLGIGNAKISINGRAENERDSVSRTLVSVPQGFPISESQGGSFNPGENTLTLRLPQKWQRDSLRVQLKAFPSPVADALQGLEGMLHEPNGCFEQTTSSNYPNTMVLRLLGNQAGQAATSDGHGQSKLAAVRRAKELLARGYARLTSYESKSGGFEWFGGDPGHEALTAFGLMQFYDMAPVFPVDQAMLTRTTNWLMSRRDGSGMFVINPRYLHSWGAPREVVSAYILWALTETKVPTVAVQLATELAWAEATAKTSNDPYVLALCAASLVNTDRLEAADGILTRLTDMAQPDGSYDGATTVTTSGGKAKQVETTSLVALAFQKRPQFSRNAAPLMKWLQTQRGGGHFGSTQATVLALKVFATVPSVLATNSTVAPILSVQRDGREVVRLDMKGNASPMVSLPTTVLQPGDNTFLVMNATGSPLPFAVDIQLHADQPASDERCPLRLATKLSNTSAKAGEVVTLNVKLTNTADRGQPMSMVTLGLPGGLEARTKQLDELKDKGVIDFYELRSREVTIYWRTLAAKQEVELNLDLTAEIPGLYTGPASRTWLYYTAEQKQWVSPLQIEITQ